MSTRANIKITDGKDELIFYRHSDGYPEGTLPTLRQFLELVKHGHIRDNTMQAAGWLVIIGHTEYKKGELPNTEDRGMGWKVGAYEPTTEIHPDIEYLYTINLQDKTIKIETPIFNDKFDIVRFGPYVEQPTSK